MKLKTTLLAVMLAMFAAPTAFAAEEPQPAAKAEAPKAEAAKPMRKHNHMEEKTGMQIPEPKASSNKAESGNSEPTKPMKKHFHPTDK